MTTPLPHTPEPRRRITWSAVFAGALVAMASYVALSLLGLAIGLGTVDPMTEQNPLQGLGMGAGLWLGIASILALFFGGIVAGRLAGSPQKLDAALHGLVTWSLVTIATLFLVSMSISGIVGGLTRLAGSETVAAQAQQLDAEQLRQQAAGIEVSQSQAQATGQQVAETGGTAALWSFVGMALGALAASAGGLVGQPKRFFEPPPPPREPTRVPVWEESHA